MRDDRRSKKPGLHGLLLLLLFVLTSGFRASSAKIDITPDTPQWLVGYDARKSTGVLDKLYHRIVMMEDGDQLVVLVSSDLGAISVSFYDEFARELEQETGIKPAQVWWSVTHTHSGPEVGAISLAEVFLAGRFNHEIDQVYAQRVKTLLIEGIKKAREGLAPARLGVGSGIALANMNRRAIGVDGKATLGLNPEGPVDRQVGVLRLERLDGSLIATVASYAMHGTVMSAVNLQISGDALGAIAEYVEEKSGAPMLYINGAAGNVGPIYYFHPNPRAGHMGQFRVLVGNRILETGARIRMADGPEGRLWTGQTIVETPKNQKTVWPSDLAAYFRKTDGENGLVRIPVRFLKIGDDTLIWSAPLELFCEIAIAVRENSPFANTFFYGYTNGWMGYLPTKEAFSSGGYEPRVTPFTENAEQDLRQAVIQYVQGLGREASKR